MMVFIQVYTNRWYAMYILKYHVNGFSYQVGELSKGAIEESNEMLYKIVLKAHGR